MQTRKLKKRRKVVTVKGKPVITYVPIDNPPTGNTQQNITKVRDKKSNKKFEIFAYCSKNYYDAYKLMVPSWTKLDSVEKVTVYTDWDLKPNDDKVEIFHMFDPSDDWITGTGRRMDVIRHFSALHKNKKKNILFLDIDCYITKDVNHVFELDFDIGITRLFSTEGYANKTATAGLWFARLTPGYYDFIDDWSALAKKYKERGKGIKKHFISYVQYSFTDVARKGLASGKYNILPLDEKIYNSEHSDEKKWYRLITNHKPKILHFKGRRFRNKKLVDRAIRMAGDR